MALATKPPKKTFSIASFVVRFAICGFVWWIFAGGVWTDSGVVLSVIALATVTSMALRSSEGVKWRIGPALRFVPWFLMQSVSGGLDVSQRALLPGGRVDPGLVNYPMRLRGPGRIFFVWVVSLLPGTASVEIEGDTLITHALDRSLPVQETLRDMEERIAAIFQ